MPPSLGEDVRHAYRRRGLACAWLEVGQGYAESKHGYSIAVSTALRKSFAFTRAAVCDRGPIVQTARRCQQFVDDVAGMPCELHASRTSLWKTTPPVSRGIRLDYRKAQAISPGAAPGTFQRDRDRAAWTGVVLAL